MVLGTVLVEDIEKDSSTNVLKLARAIQASDTPLAGMIDQASGAGLKIEPHITAALTNRNKGKLHKSRNHVYRLKSPLLRPLITKGKPTRIHPSVKMRYEKDISYRPKAGG